MHTKPHVIVIGAGFTGCAIAYDLAQRGFEATVLERGEIASGTSGRTHGLLHSGGRYCVDDQEAAIECINENVILRRIASQCIEFNGGMFVALDETDFEYGMSFEKGAQACHIPIEKLTSSEALRLEPNLNPKVLSAYTVPDGTFDPLRLALAFAASAVSQGASFYAYHEVEGLLINGKGEVAGARVWNRSADHHYELRSDLVLSATGAWAGRVAGMAGVKVPVIPTPGVMVAFDQRLTQRPVNRLAVPGDGDIILPQRRMSVIGTTSFEVEDPDYIPVDNAQVHLMVERATALVPAVASTHLRGTYMSARPLITSGTKGRSLSRTFKCYDHATNDGINGFVTITGGKATTCRVMAEKAVDLVCEKMGVNRICQTSETTLKPYRNFYTFEGEVP